MLDLSQKQLEFLAIVDGQDDWNPSAFLDVVTEHYETAKEKPFDKTEFEKMMQEVRKLTTEKIAEFQIALNIMESL
ncbi:MAG: hypothetical protein V7K76_22875 [Nostoc sp.]|uniref:hypothetical protein n=1 Tax=Nostoc sp. TaxID=1180 RepID=UPI002FF67EF2